MNLDRRTHCHAFATPRVGRGVDLSTIQVLLGHKSLEITMVYTRVARKGPAGLASPLDLLDEGIAAAPAANRRLA